MKRRTFVLIVGGDFRREAKTEGEDIHSFNPQSLTSGRV
jgi:hypothetical protein